MSEGGGLESEGRGGGLHDPRAGADGRPDSVADHEVAVPAGVLRHRGGPLARRDHDRRRRGRAPHRDRVVRARRRQAVSADRARHHNRAVRYTRNPMYTGVVFVMVGQGLLFGSRGEVIYGLCWFAFFHIFEVFLDDPFIVKRMGKRLRGLPAHGAAVDSAPAPVVARPAGQSARGPRRSLTGSITMPRNSSSTPSTAMPTMRNGRAGSRRSDRGSAPPAPAASRARARRTREELGHILRIRAARKRVRRPGEHAR